MSCEWRDRVAELEAEPAVARHLEACVECRELEEALRADMAAWRAAHDKETPHPAHYTAVRARVMAAVRADRRRRMWRFVLIGAAASLAVVIALLVEPRPARVPPAPTVVRVEPPPPPLLPAPLPVAKQRRPKRRTVESHAQPVLVKLLTDDPNVVIYWIMDRQGD